MSEQSNLLENQSAAYKSGMVGLAKKLVDLTNENVLLKQKCVFLQEQIDSLVDELGRSWEY